MSRDDGFRTADVDVNLLDDPKVRALVRSTRDEALVARCLVAYMAILTASWERAERIPLEDAAPAWLTGLDDLRDRLAEVQLVDEQGRLVERAFDAWIGPAIDRQASFRERWRRANDKRRKADTDAVPRGDSGGTDAVPGPTGRQAGPSGPSGLRTREENHSGPQRAAPSAPPASARQSDEPPEALDVQAELDRFVYPMTTPDAIVDRVTYLLDSGFKSSIVEQVGRTARQDVGAAEALLTELEARVPS
jgi:hypothetical protein